MIRRAEKRQPAAVPASEAVRNPVVVDADAALGRGANAGPRSPTRTLRILEIIAEYPEGVTLAFLSQRLEIPKTSIFNLLRPLVSQAYLMQVASRYLLGPAALRFAIHASRNSSFLRAISPTLELYGARLGETIALVMLDESETQTEYMDVVESTRPIHYVVRPGERRPLYCTAAGTAILAWQKPEFVERYLATADLRKLTPKTVTDPQAILERLEVIRRDGIAVTMGDYSEELCGFAAPIFSRAGVAIGAIASGAPLARALAAKETYFAMIKQAAEGVTAELRGGVATSLADLNE